MPHLLQTSANSCEPLKRPASILLVKMSPMGVWKCPQCPKLFKCIKCRLIIQLRRFLTPVTPIAIQMRRNVASGLCLDMLKMMSRDPMDSGMMP